jgi:hypothetical protein
VNETAIAAAVVDRFLALRRIEAEMNEFEQALHEFGAVRLLEEIKLIA